MIGIDDDEDDGPLFVVCIPADMPSLFHDDVFDVCQFCRVRVRHRPNIVWPRRIICSNCFQERREPDDTVLITKKSIQELLSKLRH